jgi:hypothetical protein
MPGYQVDQGNLPSEWPTNGMAAAFWEELGRTVATFGALERTLGKAIFAISATTEIQDGDDGDAEIKAWHKRLKEALNGTLVPLTRSLKEVIERNPSDTFENFDELYEDLKRAASIRNLLTHAMWGIADEVGANKPHFVDRKMQVSDTDINIKYLQQVRAHTVGLICSVISVVTSRGIRFPGTQGPGEPVV